MQPFLLLTCTKLAPESQSITHFGDLHTPVEQPLGVQATLVVPDVFQQGAAGAELGHQLQTGARADAQQPDDVGMVQAAHGEHVLHRGNTIITPLNLYLNHIDLF